MLIIIIMFFSVVIGVNIFMAVVSQTSWTGLVVDNSYVASQEFEVRRLAHLKQQEAGWAPAFEIRDGQAILTLADGMGTPVDLGAVTVKINRVVGGHEDQTLALVRGEGATYTAPVSLAPGVWEALVDAPATALGPFDLHERFTLKDAVTAKPQ
jgi:nitrogen fixation protein FixH